MDAGEAAAKVDVEEATATIRSKEGEGLPTSFILKCN